MAPHTKLILGGPGSGKTTRLLNIVDEHLSSGVDPSKIAFVSFTRAAANEAKDRAVERFGISPKALRNFRTLHSLCFEKTGTRRNSVIQKKDYVTISDRLGIDISGSSLNDSQVVKDGDIFAYLEGLARTTKRPLKDAWLDNSESCEYPKLLEWVATYNEYKASRRKLDFTDILKEFVENDIPAFVDVAIVDEAQDLTPLEWDVVRVAFRKAKKLYLAGDDDQAIYMWSGADNEQFMSVPHDEREVLPYSHRLPKKVFSLVKNFAEKRIKHRYEKDWGPAPDNGEGVVKWITTLEELDLSKETWFMLSRNALYLRGYVTYLMQRGIPFSHRGERHRHHNIQMIKMYQGWINGKMYLTPYETQHMVKLSGSSADEILEKKEPWYNALKKLPLKDIIYLRKIGSKYGTLEPELRIHLNTVHAVKGAEMDNVVLNLDMTKRSHAGITKLAGEEQRVYYVGASRAKKALFLMHEKTKTHYTGFYGLD